MSEVVGREAELRAITGWFRGPGPAVLVVEGPAGLGKTTVWSSAVAAIRADGGHVLQTAPTEAESGLSYSGLADLLGSSLDRMRDALPPPQARALAVAMRLEEPGDRPADETAVARGALETLLGLGRAGRVLVAVDDLRWLDGPSLAAITYVARRLPGGGPVRLLATHRTGAAGLEDLVDGPTPIERLELGPLSVGGIHRIVRLHTGIALPRPRLLEIHGASAGNPLHAVELARLLGGDDQQVAGSLAGLFGLRIAALPAPARDALVTVAASADRTIDRLDRARPGFADDALPAVADGLLVLAGASVRPAHPLVTHVAYESADPARRRDAHRALADSATNDEERALHLGRSVDGADDRAADVLEAAARTARARGVRALSATLFERAAELTTDPDRRAARLLDAASAWFDAGDTHRVEAILEPLVAASPPDGRRAEARWRLGKALDESGRWPEATALWQAALEESSDPALRSQIRCSLAITAMYTESLDRAVAWATSAVDEAEGSGNPAALGRSLAVAAFILAMGGREGSDRAIERALALEATIDESLGEWSPSAMAAEIARQTGDVRGSLRHYAAVLDAAVARGDANVEQWAAFGLGQAEVLAGGFRHASELADVVLDIADQTDVMTIPARSLRAHVDAWLGDFVNARRYVGEAIERSEAADELAHRFGATVVLGAIETCAGNPAAAAAAFEAARRMGAQLGFGHATPRRIDLLAAEASAAAGDVSAAREAFGAFDAAAGSPTPAWAVSLRHRAAAAILGASGDVAAAVAELEASIAADPLPIDEARSLLALGATLRRLREHRRSRAATERALERFTELGTPPWVDAAERELARLPGRRPGPGRELTNAESAIASLVAAGRSNREVAAELVLSIKTVEVTLTRVYEKLGVRSRSELAARFRERAGEPL